MADYDFCGWATRNNIKCSDGRVIRKDAFKECDGKRVPLVWMHQHNSVENVLGHAILENRDDGVYTYGVFNNTPAGQDAKEMVKNGDVTGLSIYANKLRQNGHDVFHGAIREVSLVLAGANPGAYIETVLAHSDDQDEEAVVYFGESLETDNMQHSEECEKSIIDEDDNQNGIDSSDEFIIHAEEKDDNMADKTIGDVIKTMNEEQKNVLYALVGMAAEGQMGDLPDDEDDDMKHNIFTEDYYEDDYLAHAEDFEEIIRDAKRCGSLRDSALEHGMEDLTAEDVMAHGNDYGITNIDMLFPDYKTTSSIPGFVSRDMTWVSGVMQGVSHTPFSRIKSIFANITEDEARAKGYMKGKIKKEEVFTLLKRTTDPQTIYKKQKLDRDDMIDITGMDVVLFLKGEMRKMLDEEIARAILVGDGRESHLEDKIQEVHIRPIWTDDDFYTVKAGIGLAKEATEDDKYSSIIRTAIKARKNYKGSGNPVFYTTEDNLTGMLLLTDKTGRDLYASKEALANKLRVSDIVTVPVMENLTRTDAKDSNKVKTLEGIIVNLKDYNVGADEGGNVNLFDDFDIDYNQHKYLIETRCSGALTKPYSAIAIETYTDPGNVGI